MKRNFSGWSKLVELTQLGLTLVLPMVVFPLLAHWLQSKHGWGGWVMPAAFLLGFLTMATGFYQFYRQHSKRKGDDQPPSSFNRHE